jgi:hypothetical protein
MKTIRLAAFLVIILFVSSISYSQNITYLGSTLWSGVNDVKIQGNYAYCAFFNGLVILNITNPINPTFVSQLYIGGNDGDYDRRAGQKLFVSGNYVYFTADYTGLSIIDVSDPSNPTLVCRYNTPSYASDVAVQGNYAFVACQSTSLEILDIEDPASPVLMGPLHS